MTDVIVIGAGAAGLAAVREAKRRDASAILISAEAPGGDCTFTGCVPSKTLIESAAVGASFDEAFRRAGEVVADIAATETADTIRREGIEVIEGFGILVGPGRVEIDGRTLEAKGVVLALGSQPAVPPIDGLEAFRSSLSGDISEGTPEADPQILTSDTLWGLTSKPKSMAIIGAGAIGCELGLALSRLGVQVTLIEGASRVLPLEEEAASAIIDQSLRDNRVRVIVGQLVSSIQVSSIEVSSIKTDGETSNRPDAVLALADGSTVVVERILMASGRRPVTSGAGAVDLDKRGFIVTEPSLATSIDRVYAAGDTTGRAPFTHAADAMGRLAVSNILRRFGSSSFRSELVPKVTYTHPEVASIGISESEAASLKGARVAELPMSEHDRARTAGIDQGYIKIIAAPRKFGGSLGGGRIVGATIVAPRAGEMISEISLMMRTDAMVGRLAQTMHPYPSWSYGLAKAAGQFFTEIEGRVARPAVGKQS